MNKRIRNLKEKSIDSCIDNENRFYLKCSQCGKIYPIEKGRYLCDDCMKKQEKGKPLSGILLVDFNIDNNEIEQAKNVQKNFLKTITKSILEKDNITSIKNAIKNKHKDSSINILTSIDVRKFLPSSNIPDLPVGNTPIIRSKRLEEALGVQNLFLKWDGANLSGSFKDRASILVSSMAKKFGENDIVVASTGNAASSMAAIGAAMGQNIYIFAPSSAPTGKLAQILQYGAKLFLIDGSYDDAFDLSMKFTEETKFLSRNTGYNPFTIEGKKTISYELLFYKEFESIIKIRHYKNSNKTTFYFNNEINCFIEPPDFIFVPVGDGVIISGLIKGFLDLQKLGFIDRLPVIVGVQAEGSNYIYNAFNTGIFSGNYISNTIADSISVNSPRCGYLAIDLIKQTNGFFTIVTDDEILSAQHLLSKTSGIFAEPSSSSTIAAIMKNTSIIKDKRVVALLTGNGLKDINSSLKIFEVPKPIKNSFNSVMDYYNKIKR